ncbi:helix-turn-helix domain-containing protein [Caldimonas thermodepolymerans]|jgi:putative transcriptional regulator|uniref:helix-turn-helix domain-containing protein n=1 Tax=Caldimonas thermodepolymerans TaxID=215580 RepID=UPI0022355E5F|nr:helix-turn-helix transcriptional regulator [Caldimonas thermodepolymerans]UZG46026.1 helix-turn-helix transcriptional regulator [Caldimonas thermodepolymerans]
MIRCHFARLLGERKLKISDVTRATGINRGTLTRLYYETAERIELGVVDQLCRYFGVGVGELLEYVEDTAGLPVPETVP